MENNSRRRALLGLVAAPVGLAACATAEGGAMGAGQHEHHQHMADVMRRLDEMESRAVRLGRGVNRTLTSHESRLQSLSDRTGRAAALTLTRAEKDLDGLAARARAHDPALALARGWSITTGPDGRAIRSVSDLVPGTVIETRLVDGSVTSTVTPDGIHPHPAPNADPNPEASTGARP